MTKVIMFQGTGSGVGKSLVVSGFCRLLVNQGIKVAPFKSQNMALNSGVTSQGLEMGRAQILQAEAAQILPDTRMNPILLKPQGNHTSQLIRHGKVVGSFSAQEYYQLAEENFEIVKTALDSLCQEYDVVLIEGAGSPAEINLQSHDIVNMKVAEYANADVFIIGDIDRGGVFAWMKGTYDLVLDHHRSLIKGFIINKFRGDFELLRPGIEMFESYVPVKVLGTIPFEQLNLEDEDSQNISSHIQQGSSLKIGVIRFPFISNFTDFSPLKGIDQVSLYFIDKAADLDEMDIIILPGSKDTLSDLSFLKEKGFFEKIKECYRKKLMIGICGGFQMFGNTITDPHGVEGSNLSSMEGLGLIKMKTILGKEKVLENKLYQGKGLFEGLEWRGYEIHMGVSEIADSNFKPGEASSNTLMVNQSDKLIGTYIHGLFENKEVTQSILNIVDPQLSIQTNYAEEKEKELNYWANVLDQHCDVKQILNI